jgi:hypothetical protein
VFPAAPTIEVVVPLVERVPPRVEPFEILRVPKRLRA